MPSLSNSLLLLGALVPSVYIGWYPFLNTFGGRMGDAKLHHDHMNHGPLNNDKCQVFPEGKACEDVRIHYETGTAFLACGYPEGRAVFYPPIHRTGIVRTKSLQEYFLKYDLETDKVSKLDVVGWDKDLVLHGIDIRHKPEDPKSIDLFVVNHKRQGESILVFSHVLGSNTLNFVEEYTHSLIKTPNAVAATGPDSFFITNDHWAHPTTFLGIPRIFQALFGPFHWASSVVHCSTVKGKAQCKTVSPSNYHPSANGAVLVDEGKTLLVNDLIKAKTIVYDVHPVSKMLTVRKEIHLGAAADNITPIQGGDFAVAIFPDVSNLAARLIGDGILNSSLTSPAAVLRLNKAKDYEPEVIYWDDGSLITILTGAAVDPKRKKMIAGGVIERHFIVCDLEGDTF